MLIYETDFALIPYIIYLHFEGERHLISKSNHRLFTWWYLGNGITSTGSLRWSNTRCICRGALWANWVTYKCIEVTARTKRSLTQAAKLGGPISERTGMGESCESVCVFVCVAHTSYFSLQCSHGHDHSCPLKSSPPESHTDKWQAGAASLCMYACVWRCVYITYGTEECMFPHRNFRAWLRHTVEENVTRQPNSHVDSIYGLFSRANTYCQHGWHARYSKGCVFMQMHSRLSAWAQQCLCWTKWQLRDQEKPKVGEGCSFHSRTWADGM